MKITEWNLDAETIDELTRITRRKSTPEPIRAYAREKRCAMRARIAGEIDTALRHEHNCDVLYSDLPDDLRTW
jgi:hypothetical protein